MSDETNIPEVEETKKPAKKAAPKKAEPTIQQKRAALIAEREEIKDRLLAIQTELTELSVVEAKDAPPPKTSYELWLEQKKISDSRKRKQAERSAEVKKVLAELGFTD